MNDTINLFNSALRWTKHDNGSFIATDGDTCLEIVRDSSGSYDLSVDGVEEDCDRDLLALMYRAKRFAEV